MYKKLITFFILLFLIGCQQLGNTDDGNTVPHSEVELGAYSFGTLLDVEMDELIRFVYEGEEIRIPYHVEGLGQGIVNQFAWFVLVDGLPQPTRLEMSDGSIFREKSYMHHFELEFLERHEFYVVFVPISGSLGETVSFIAGGILRPDFLPEDIENPSFRGFHHLTATIPAEILINYPIPESAFPTMYNKLDDDLIPQTDELLAQIQLLLMEGQDVNDIIAYFPVFNLFPADGNVYINYDGLLKVDESGVRMRLLLLGGQEVTSRITFFVNHKPVEVNDVDFIEVLMRNEMMLIMDVSLQVEQLDALNSVYAIIMTAGEDYHVQDIFKTPTLLLVNDMR